MSNSDQQTQTESWPRKLNKALIAVGVIAFGLIVTDRLLEAFRADDLPLEEATLTAPDAMPEQPETETVIAELPTPAVPEAPQAVIAEASEVVVAQEITESTVTQAEVLSSDNDPEMLVELESMFGSRVVFVSAAEPAYLVTADERRFDVGSELDNETTLAGITAQKIFFDQAGDTIVIHLPEPAVQ